MKTRTKIIASLFAILAFIGILHFASAPNPSAVDGYITFILVDEQQAEVINERIDFKEGETLYDVLQRHYKVVCADELYQPDDTCAYSSLFGKAILEVETIKTDWTNNFLSLYINDEYASFGVSQLEFNDGDIISFRWTDLS